MVLFAIVGELGAGKTMSLVYLSWFNWFYKREKIFSNIHLYKIPYVFVDSINKMRKMENGFVSIDEMWSILKARTSMSQRNKIVGDIILRSRKLGLTYCFTTQLLSLIDKNIRDITDFVAYPVMSVDEKICKLAIFKGSSTKKLHIKDLYFSTEMVKQMYDTNEIVDMKEESNDDILQIRFQENRTEGHKRFCECSECNGQIFENWEEAEKVANEYWLKLYRLGKFKGYL